MVESEDEIVDMTPEEVHRLYVRSIYRGAFCLVPFFIVAGLLGLVGQFAIPPNSPPGYAAVVYIVMVGTVMAGMVTFIFIRRCPKCGCRSPEVKFSRGHCRRCGVRL